MLPTKTGGECQSLSAELPLQRFMRIPPKALNCVYRVPKPTRYILS